MQHKLSRYIIPSVISMVLVGTYTNIDGLFIGNAAGDAGLAAINIVWPIFAFITALGTGIGIGGSVMLNNMLGSGHAEDAESVKKTMLMLLGISGIISSVVLAFLYKPILFLMGAQGIVRSYAENYSVVISCGAVFQIMGAGLIVILRNEGKTYRSMLLSLVGLLIHIILDYMLVGSCKLYGVAVSTVLSQAAVTVLALLSIRISKDTRVCRRYIPDMLRRATAPFGVNFVPSAVLLFTNYFALKTGGTAAVSCYAVMSYAVYTFDYIFQGVCDGIQPLISYSRGAEDVKGEVRIMKYGGIILALISIACMLLTPILIKITPRIFSVSQTAEHMMRSGFIIYAFSYPFKAGVKYICSYYYASGQTRLSNILTYLDPLVLTPLFLCVLSGIFGLNGIWLAMLMAQILLLLIGVYTMSSCGGKR